MFPPEVARELAKAAGSDFLTLDLAELNIPPFETIVDQHGALGMIMQIKAAWFRFSCGGFDPLFFGGHQCCLFQVEVKEIQLKGMEGVQARRDSLTGVRVVVGLVSCGGLWNRCSESISVALFVRSGQ